MDPLGVEKDEIILVIMRPLSITFNENPLSLSLSRMVNSRYINKHLIMALQVRANNLSISINFLFISLSKS